MKTAWVQSVEITIIDYESTKKLFQLEALWEVEMKQRMSVDIVDLKIG